MSRSICVAFCLAAFTALPVTAKPLTLTGRAEAVDGDTLTLNGKRVRLFGVDAFEWDQTCGKFACGAQADRALRLLIARQNIACEQQDIDPYGRTVAICKTTAGIDIGGEMVRRGLAVAYRTFSMKYLPDENYARTHRAGAWAYGFQSPLDYRKSKD